MYEGIIKDIKKTLYKTVGKTHLTFEQLETVVMDIERYLDLPEILAMWGQGECILENIEVEDGEFTRFDRRLCNAREHA